MEAIEKNNASNTHQEKAKKLRKLRRWQIAVSLLGAAIVVWGIVEVACLFLGYNRTETSNDAQIEQYISPINLRASGYIKKIYFTEHQEVHKGDTLLVLDDREYKIRVMEAEAALKDALAGATVIGATLQTTQTTASVYDASISEIEIRLAKLEKDRQRYQNLVQRNEATPIQLEQIETEYEATRKKLEATKRQQKAALSGVNEVSHRRESTEAAIQRATAALEMARLNLSYTVVVAPCDGKLGRRALEEGQFITAGQTITYILPDTQKWIVANYKETQVENLHIGQKVTITIAECQQPGKHPALITLLALAFQVHFALCSHDGFYIVGLTQSFHPHIIIHAQQDVFQIGTGKTVFRNLPDAAVFHIRAEDGGQHRTDLGFARRVGRNRNRMRRGWTTCRKSEKSYQPLISAV